MFFRKGRPRTVTISTILRSIGSPFTARVAKPSTTIEFLGSILTPSLDATIFCIQSSRSDRKITSISNFLFLRKWVFVGALLTQNALNDGNAPTATAFAVESCNACHDANTGTAFVLFKPQRSPHPGFYPPHPEPEPPP